MNKRIFPIDENCVVIYTGQSSADEHSFLRIGSSNSLDRTIQEHIGYIVIPDADKVDYKNEINNIKFMQKGKIRYICNKTNQEKLFAGLEKMGVNEKDLFHKDLSKDLENISRVDNKKHFFTVFYENKNVKIVSDDEVFFELFEHNPKNIDFDFQIKRLNDFINTLAKLKTENTRKKLIETISPYSTDKNITNKTCSLFLLQDKTYIPLNPKMFRVVRITDQKIRILCNTSIRFNVGKDIRLALVIDGKENLIIKGIIDSGEVIESQVLYSFSLDVRTKSIEDTQKTISVYKLLLEKVVI